MFLYIKNSFSMSELQICVIFVTCHQLLTGNTGIQSSRVLDFTAGWSNSRIISCYFKGENTRLWLKRMCEISWKMGQWSLKETSTIGKMFDRNCESEGNTWHRNHLAAVRQQPCFTALELEVIHSFRPHRRLNSAHPASRGRAARLRPELSAWRCRVLIFVKVISLFSTLSYSWEQKVKKKRKNERKQCKKTWSQASPGSMPSTACGLPHKRNPGKRVLIWPDTCCHI